MEREDIRKRKGGEETEKKTQDEIKTQETEGKKRKHRGRKLRNKTKKDDKK